MTHKVIFSPEAELQILKLYDWIANRASPRTAEQYVGAVVSTCEDLGTLPHCGHARDDMRPGLRVTHHGSRTATAFSIHPDRVNILGIFHGGQDYETALSANG